MKVWSWAAVIAATLLYLVALSHEVYTVTSPAGLSWHVLLRKGYSIVAFALVGYLAGRAALEWRRRATGPGLTLAVALYSAAIEVGQAIHGSHEGLMSNAFDVFCGAVGGWLGFLFLPKKPVRPR